MWAAIVSFFAAIGAWFGKNIVGWFMNVGKNMIAGIMSISAMWAFHAMVRIAPDQALYTARRITAAYYALPVEWAGFISEYLERMTGSRIDLTDIAGMPATGGTREAMQALGHTFLEPMLGLIMPTPEQAETEPMAGAERFMSANLQFQMSAWLLHLLGDTMSFGMFKSLKDLPNAISWSYGIGWLSWMVMGPVFRAGITAPMEKNFARYYRQAPLSNAQIIDAFYSGRKSAEVTYKELSEAGLKDTDIETMINLSRKRLPQAVMEYLVRTGFRNKAQLLQYYKDQSYTQEDAEVMVEQLLTSTKRKLIQRVVDKMEDLFKAGKITEQELRGYYTDINYDQEEQDLAIVALSVEGVKVADLSDSEICRLYQNGKMPIGEALRRLEPRYTNPDDARLLLELYPPKEKPEEVIKPIQLSPSQIGILYRIEKFTYEEALEKLRTRVPPVAEPELLLLLYEREEPEEITELLKGLTPAQVGRLYQKEIISANEAISRLVKLKYPEDEAALFLTLYPRVVPEVIVPPVRVLTPAQIASLFVSREMSYDIAISRLLGLNYSHKDADLLLISVSKEPIPPQISAAYQLGQITRDEAIPALMSWLYTESEAITYLEAYFII